MARFKGGKDRDDTFVGGTKADSFWFDPADVTSGDTIVGGDGKAIDALIFTAAGRVAADALTNVRGIERIAFAAGGNSVTLADDVVASAYGSRIEVVGSSAADGVYAGALTGVRAISVLAGAGDDRLFGGGGADVFDFTGGTLTAGDTVAGGLGVDTIRFGDQTVIGAEDLANVSQIEILQLSDVGSKLTLTAPVFTSVTGLTVNGGAGGDTIDLTQVVVNGAQTTLWINGGGGDDVIRSTAEQPPFFFVYTKIDGGAGADTIDLSYAGFVTVIYDGADRREVASGGTLIVNGAANIDLSRSKDQSLDDAAIVQGFTTVDASAATAPVHLAGGAGTVLFGSSGDDVLSGNGLMIGGKGADTILSSGAVRVSLADGDFAAGETISVHGGVLDATGTIDLTTGSVSGFSAMQLRLAEGHRSALVTMDSSLYDGLNSLYGDDGVAVKVLVGDSKAHDFYAKADGVALEFHGDAANNVMSAEIGDVFGGDGDDVLWGEQAVLGEGGDDRIGYSQFGGLMDGGDGTDTLVSLDSTYMVDLTIDLSKGDQTLGDASVVRGFENVDLSAGDAGATNIYGSAGANVLVGEQGDDVILGRGGDDLIDGGLGNDILTGGAGADTFRWLDRVPNKGGDTVTDFHSGEDTLLFDRRSYDVTGEFDQRLVTKDAHANIAGVDLLIYTGGPINEPMEVADLLSGTPGGSAKDGIFLLVRDGQGDTVLYHSSQSAGADLWDVALIADLGKVNPTHVALSDFAFI